MYKKYCTPWTEESRKIINERGDTTIDSTEMQKIMMDYKLDNLKQMKNS